MDELPLPAKLPVEEPPQLPAGMIEQIDKYLGNPLFQIAAKSHAEDIRQFIKSNSGEFEELVYEYIKGKYINIYNIIKPEEVTKEEPESEDQDEEEEPVIKPVPQAAITYEILELHKELYTPSEIADFLSEKYDITLYPMHVGRIIKKAQALAAQKPKDEPEIKQVIQANPAGQVVTMPAQTVTPAPKPLDPDMLLVVSSAAGLINYWNKIKIYVLMSIAGVAGYLLK